MCATQGAAWVLPRFRTEITLPLAGVKKDWAALANCCFNRASLGVQSMVEGKAAARGPAAQARHPHERHYQAERGCTRSTSLPRMCWLNLGLVAQRRLLLARSVVFAQVIHVQRKIGMIADFLARNFHPVARLQVHALFGGDGVGLVVLFTH